MSGLNIKLPGCVTNADLSLKRYHVVKYASDGVCAAVTAEGDVFLGILENAPDASGDVADVVIWGQTKVMVGEAVAKFQSLCVGAAGRLMLANAGSRVVGIALAAGSADGSIIDAFVYPNQSAVL